MKSIRLTCFYVVLLFLVFMLKNGYTGISPNLSVSSPKVSTFMKSTVPVLYIPYTQLLPGQARYSSKAVQAKVHKYIKRGDATWNASVNSWQGKFEHGKSIFPSSSALPVVRSPEGFVLVDGHHDVLASIYFNIPLIPITILDDLSHLDRQSFWAEAEKQGWAYLFTLIKHNNAPNNTPTIEVKRIEAPPATFGELIDDPLRYFASTTARKFRTSNEPPSLSLGAEYPLWIKIGKDTPFIEFALADMLYKHGFVYAYADGTGDDMPEKLVEQARKILVQNPVNGLRLVPERKHYDMII